MPTSDLQIDTTRYWWGRYEVVEGKMAKQWIGPMTRGEMLETDDTYRHMSRNAPPAADEGK